MVAFARILKRCGAGLLGGLALAAIGMAAPAAPLAPADRETVRRAEAALNRIRGIESRFVQASSNGGFAEGMLYVQRPGRLRIDYAPPTPLQVYADRTWLIYLDFELKEANQVPIEATPASFLVRDRLVLSGDLTVTAVERRPPTVSLEVVRTEEPDGGTLRLLLDGSTFALRGWSVIDPQGVETRITLVDPAFNRPIDQRVFLYTPPDWASGPEGVPE